VPGNAPAVGGPRVAVLAYPHASNLDEFEPLRRSGVSLVFTRDAAQLRDADWLVLPGSKHTRADLAWLAGEQLDALVRAHARSGRPLLAVCGGLQMIGERVDDPLGVEGGHAGTTAGLGLLPLATRLEPAKRLARTRWPVATLDGAWSALSGLSIEGYEIHSGRSEALSPQARPAFAGLPSLGWQRGNILGIYPHGLFENTAVVQALFGRHARPLDAVLDGLADVIEEHVDPAALMALLERR